MLALPPELFGDLSRQASGSCPPLLFSWIYNDVFWALLLIKTGDKRPITSALDNLRSEFFINCNLLAAGAVLAAVPTILVCVALERQLIRGLTLGSSKG